MTIFVNQNPEFEQGNSIIVRLRLIDNEGEPVRVNRSIDGDQVFVTILDSDTGEVMYNSMLDRVEKTGDIFYEDVWTPESNSLEGEFEVVCEASIGSGVFTESKHFNFYGVKDL